MGRKPQPTALKLLKGRPSHNPIKEGEFMPKADLPTPPKELSKDAHEEWVRISQDLYNQGVLTKYDRAVLSIYCQLFGRWIEAERMLKTEARKDPSNLGLAIYTANGNLIQNPLVGICNKAARDCLKYGAELGLTPSARVGLIVDTSNKPKSKSRGWFDD